jgi:hypothetical protein
MDASSQDPAPRSWSARVLVPIALVATVAAALLIVVGTLGSDDPDDASTETTTAEQPTGCPDNPMADAAVENGFYVIKPGENLSTVVERTCVEIEEIETLNPELDPQLLPVGACVNLEPEGCKAAAATPAPAAATTTTTSPY